MSVIIELIVNDIPINHLDWLVDAFDEDNRSEAHNYGGTPV